MTAETVVGPESGEDFFARAKPKRRTVHTELVLDSDLVDEWKRLRDERDLILVEEAGQSNRLASGGQGKKSRRLLRKETEIRACEEKIEAVKTSFTLVAMPSEKYQHLKDTTPPREGNEFDRLHGYNRDAVGDAAVRVGLVNPKFKDCTKDGCTHDPDRGDACGSFQQLRVILNPSEWQELRDAAQEANGAVKDVPKLQQESSPRRRLANGSAQPASGE